MTIFPRWVQYKAVKKKKTPKTNRGTPTKTVQFRYEGKADTSFPVLLLCSCQSAKHLRMFPDANITVHK